MDIYLIRLIIAHLIGDFFLQPNAWVKDKERRKLKSAKLYLHVMIHVALIFVIFLSFDVWKAALTIGIIHLIIDALKSIFQTNKNARILFFADQVLHFSLIVVVWHLFYKGSLDIGFLMIQIPGC